MLSCRSPGFPACFLNHPYIHEARCTSVAISAKKDCGNAKTTGVSCIDRGCCWKVEPGSPFCYHPDPTITNTTTTTSNPDVTTGSTIGTKYLTMKF